MPTPKLPRPQGAPDSGADRALRPSAELWRLVPLLLAGMLLSACGTKPLLPYSTDTPPLVLTPTASAGVVDKRGRFREIFCAVLGRGGADLPDYRPCDEALVEVGTEPPGSGAPVDLGESRRRLTALVVPGIGWDCFADWLHPSGSVATHLRKYGYDAEMLQVDALSGSAHNARQIRDALMRRPDPGGSPDIVLVGYSKGAPDILEAIVAFPEIRPRIAAVVSTAGAIGGSALANEAEQWQVNLLQYWPGSRCTAGDGGGLEDLRPAARKAWLAENPLPSDVPYYSLVTFPDPARISAVLRPSYRKLARIDARNDSQVTFYDQVIPGSRLIGYVNADHWALAVPVARSHSLLRATLVNHNDFPREALLEAILRMVEQDLGTAP